MEALWRSIVRFIVRFLERLGRMVAVRGRAAQETEQPAVPRLEAYRELAAELGVVKGEHQALPEEQRSVQAALCLAAAAVVRVLADTLSLFVIGGHTAAMRGSGVYGLGRAEAFRVERRAPLAGGLYRQLFRLLERARREMTDPAAEPHPLDPEELVGEELPGEPLEGLQAAAQELEETFELELRLGEANLGNLPALLARLRTKSRVALTLAAKHHGRRASAEAEEQVWGVELHRRIFALWVLIAQELVQPGITTTLAESRRDPDPWDTFLMTDPVARARYEREGRLGELEVDIRYAVMRGRPWEPADLEYLQGANRLESCGVLHRMASFWNISPHPPVYKAVKGGRIFVGGRVYRFRRGQDIVWACPMLRDLAGLNGPVLVNRFDSKRITVLCGAMSNAVLGRGLRAPLDSAQRSA